MEKLKEQKEKLDQKLRRPAFLPVTSKALRLRIREKRLREKLREYSRRGSFKAVCNKLQKATDLGLLDDKNTLKAMLKTVEGFKKPISRSLGHCIKKPWPANIKSSSVPVFLS